MTAPESTPIYNELICEREFEPQFAGTDVVLRWALAAGWLLLIVQAATLVVVAVTTGWCASFAGLLAAFTATTAVLYVGEVRYADRGQS